MFLLIAPIHLFSINALLMLLFVVVLFIFSMIDLSFLQELPPAPDSYTWYFNVGGCHDYIYLYILPFVPEVAILSSEGSYDTDDSIKMLCEDD